MKIFKKLNRRQSHPKHRGGFKFAECVSKLDMFANTTASKYTFFFVINRLMEVKDREITCS